MPHLTSTAGRHAADRERARLESARRAEVTASQDAARDALVRALRLRGLRVLSRFDAEDRSIHVTLGVETMLADEQRVASIVEAAGWRLTTLRLSRYRDYIDNVWIVHVDTGAQILLTTHRPGVLRQGEAA